MQTIPWDKVKIRLIGIEINHLPEGKAAVKKYMDDQGFKFYKKIVIDYFFYNPQLSQDMNLSFINAKNLWSISHFLIWNKYECYAIKLPKQVCKVNYTSSNLTLRGTNMTKKLMNLSSICYTLHDYYYLNILTLGENENLMRET